MLVERLWSNTIIEHQKQEHYTNEQTDPLDNLLTTHPIQTGWELSIELYPNWQCRIIADPECVFHDSSVSTLTQTQSGGLEPLLTLPPAWWWFQSLDSFPKRSWWGPLECLMCGILQSHRGTCLDGPDLGLWQLYSSINPSCCEYIAKTSVAVSLTSQGTAHWLARWAINRHYLHIPFDKEAFHP